MLKIIQFCLKYWLIPIIAFGLVVLIFIVLIFIDTKVSKTIGFIILGAGFIGIGYCVKYFYSNKKKLARITTLLAAIGGAFIAFLAFFILPFISTLIDGDHWADDLKIPKDIQLENPIGTYNDVRPDSIFKLKKTETDLMLFNACQPGMYEYDFWISRIDSGIIYLKAFEITHNEKLSENNLKENSQILIKNESESCKRFSTKHCFTIYEGDWGKYYAARFEVWFKPASGEIERKLFQKNFKKEGWMY